MTRRLAVALATLALLLVPAVAATASPPLATPAPTVLAADDGEEADEDHGGEGEEGEHEEVELVNMDNGDPADAGAQALAGTSGASFVVVMMWVVGGLAVALLAAGLTLGRGRNA